MNELEKCQRKLQRIRESWQYAFAMGSRCAMGERALEEDMLLAEVDRLGRRIESLAKEN